MTNGQLAHQWRHLHAKLAVRDRAWARGLVAVKRIGAAPVLRTVPGAVEEWERVPSRR